MEYIKLNNTDLSVSAIGLGTAFFGASTTKEDSKEQLSKFVDQGGNFIDTAHVYNDWIKGEKSRSEKVIGEWLSETKNRDKVILSTKGVHPEPDHIDISRMSTDNIQKDLDESLLFLNTDYIDLYFLHRDDTSVGVEEIIDKLEECKKQGKIKYYGCSNWSLSRIKEARAYADKSGADGFVCNQTWFSLADININNVEDKTLVIMDKEMYDYHVESKMNMVAYSSIAKGYFAKRFQAKEMPAGLEAWYKNESNDKIYKKMLEIAKSTGLTIGELSIRYVITQKFPSIPLVSFSNESQFNEGISACSKIITQEDADILTVMKKFIC